MKIVAIIPCRFGSKRFQGKPIMPILGKPMIQWVYERAMAADILDDVIVAADDERIRRVVEQFGGKVRMTAPEHRSGTDRAAEGARLLGLDKDDIVINIQGDQPAFDRRSLQDVVAPLREDPTLGMATLIYKITEPAELEDPNHVKTVFDKDHFALYFSRSLVPFGQPPDVGFDVFKHLGIYAYRTWFLERFSSLPRGRLEIIERLEQLRALEHGQRVKVVETAFDSLEVDTEKDIKKLEAALRRDALASQVDSLH